MRSLKYYSAPIAVALMSFFVAILVFYSMRGHQPQQAFSYICQTVYDKHYYGHSALEGWFKKCMSHAAALKRSATSEDVVRLAKIELAEIVTSHLDVYSPSEDQLVWKGHEDLDSGIRVRAIDGRFIVSRVYPQGAAAAAGVLVGDEIVKLEKGGILSPSAIQLASGKIEIHRLVTIGGGVHEVPLTLNIIAKELQIDQGPQVARLAADVGLLEISSFRQEYFKKEDWLKVLDQLQDYPSLVIDIRGNLGGDFVAVLRALSPFVCGEKNVGELVRPQAAREAAVAGPAAEEAATTPVAEGVSSEHLYEQLTTHARLKLNTFSYPCYNGAITVLADGDSASVSEIFALAMKSRRQTRVWGDTTRGDMLLGVWYALNLLGKGFTMSVPEALYISPEGVEIEGHGVNPQRVLYYKLEEARRGQDSWLKAALGAY